MDDQNQTNQPLSQGMNPNNPSVPEDITPKEAPLSSTTPEPSSPMMAPAQPMAANEPTDLYTSNQPMSPMPTAPVETTTTTTAETPFSSPVSAPSVTTEAPEIPTPTQTEPTPAEPTLPEAKPKKKILPVIGGIAALLLVAGVAGAAYYVSNQLSTRQAVAPTAPESKPAASCDACTGNGTECENAAGNTRGKCYNSCCSYQEIYCGGCISGWRQMTKTCNEWIAEECGGGGGGGGTSSCTKDGTYNGCDYVDNKGDTGPKGSSCGTSNWANKACTSYTFKCGVYCLKSSCGAKACSSSTSASCDASKRDTPASKSITFSKAGKVFLFTRNMAGKVTLTGPQTVTIDSTNGQPAVKQSTSFDVNANETYTIKVRLSAVSEKGDAYGWIPNKSATKCGPVKNPGDASKGKCGSEVDIEPVMTLASASAQIVGVTAGDKGANVQCWGDWARGDSTQDYDYNDFTLVFGYAKEEVAVGACTAIKVYKKGTDGNYGSTPLTQEQLRDLKIGDVLKFELNSSMDNLNGRFRVTHNTTEVGDWLTGTIDATNKKLVTYSDYTVAAAGTYIFEAQVTTTP